jgi:hypothetical protein
MDMDALPSTSRPAAEVDPDALPLPDPDTKAYFQKVAEQIEEMTAQRNVPYGQRETQIVINDAGEEEEVEAEDERPLLLRSALESLSGHEIELAGDGETSVVLYAMDDFAKRVLLDRFAGQFEKLVKHRSVSHVLQTLFELAGETVDREVRSPFLLTRFPISPFLTIDSRRNRYRSFLRGSFHPPDHDLPPPFPPRRAPPHPSPPHLRPLRLALHSHPPPRPLRRSLLFRFSLHSFLWPSRRCRRRCEE